MNISRWDGSFPEASHISLRGLGAGAQKFVSLLPLSSPLSGVSGCDLHNFTMKPSASLSWWEDLARSLCLLSIMPEKPTLGQRRAPWDPLELCSRDSKACMGTSRGYVCKRRTCLFLDRQGPYIPLGLALLIFRWG